MAAGYIVLIAAAVIAIIIFIPVDAVISVSCSDKNADGCIFIRYAFVKVKLFPTEKEKEKIKEDVKTEEKEAEKSEKNVKAILKLAKTVYKELKRYIKLTFARAFQNRADQGA